MFISTYAKPQTYKKTSKDHYWVQAMKEKLADLEANQT